MKAVIFFPLLCHQINRRHILISNISAKQRRPSEYGGGIFTSKSPILSLDAHILRHSLLVSTSYMTTHSCKRNWEHVTICSWGHNLLLEPSFNRRSIQPPPQGKQSKVRLQDLRVIQHLI